MIDKNGTIIHGHKRQKELLSLLSLDDRKWRTLRVWCRNNIGTKVHRKFNYRIDEIIKC